MNKLPHVNIDISKTNFEIYSAPWTDRLDEGMNCSLQEYFCCKTNGTDQKYTEWSTDVKLCPSAYNSQITTTCGLPPFGWVFNQKLGKTIMFTSNSSTNAQGYCQPTNDSIYYNLPFNTCDKDLFHHPQ